MKNNLLKCHWLGYSYAVQGFKIDMRPWIDVFWACVCVVLISINPNASIWLARFIWTDTFFVFHSTFVNVAQLTVPLTTLYSRPNMCCNNSTIVMIMIMTVTDILRPIHSFSMQPWSFDCSNIRRRRIPKAFVWYMEKTNIYGIALPIRFDAFGWYHFIFFLCQSVLCCISSKLATKCSLSPKTTNNAHSHARHV